MLSVVNIATMKGAGSRTDTADTRVPMKRLKARLYEAELKRREAKASADNAAKSDIGWGHQIRSYVLDQSRIKDLRTNYEVGNTQAILDGDLDDFIAASLKQGV